MQKSPSDLQVWSVLLEEDCRYSLKGAEPFVPDPLARAVALDKFSLLLAFFAVAVSYSKSSIVVYVDAGNVRVVLDGRDGRPAAAVGFPLQCVPCLHP